jgi:hypothetical protein
LKSSFFKSGCDEVQVDFFQRRAKKRLTEGKKGAKKSGHFLDIFKRAEKLSKSVRILKMSELGVVTGFRATTAPQIEKYRGRRVVTIISLWTFFSQPIPAH